LHFPYVLMKGEQFFLDLVAMKIIALCLCLDERKAYSCILHTIHSLKDSYQIYTKSLLEEYLS
jgi:hypothetical protein